MAAAERDEQREHEHDDHGEDDQGVGDADAEHAPASGSGRPLRRWWPADLSWRSPHGQRARRPVAGSGPYVLTRGSKVIPPLAGTPHASSASTRPGDVIQRADLVGGEPAGVVGVVPGAYGGRVGARRRAGTRSRGSRRPRHRGRPARRSPPAAPRAPQRGLLEHLAGGRLDVGLARLDPAAGHRPGALGRLLAAPHQQQPPPSGVVATTPPTQGIRSPGTRGHPPSAYGP